LAFLVLLIDNGEKDKKWRA